MIKIQAAWTLQERALPRDVAATPAKVLVVEGTPPSAVAAIRCVAAIMRAAQVGSAAPTLVLQNDTTASRTWADSRLACEDRTWF